MSRISRAVLAAALLSLPLAGAASAATMGAEVGVGSISPCPSFCGGSGGTSDFAFDGGPNETLALVNFDNTATLGHGIGQGRADFTGPNGLPHLRALADAEPNARVSVGSTGYRGFDYSGPATTIVLNISLIGNAETPIGSSALDARIRGTVALVLGDDLPHSTDPGTFLFEIVPGEPGLEQCGDVFDMSVTANAGVQILNGSVQCDVSDGDRFFVWSHLSASATRNSLASAFDSLEMSFLDTEGITAVPEPSLGLLVLAAAAALHRRRSA